jgi:hypothetical protein
MYDHDALTTRQIGGPFCYQTILMAGTTPVWVSPAYLTLDDVRITEDYLKGEIRFADCNECGQPAYKLTDVLGDAFTSTPELAWVCREHHSELMAEVDV